MSRLPTPSKTLTHSQQAIHDDLNTRLHNSRHINQRLQQELDKEKELGKATVRDLQQKHHQEIRQWKAACDALHGLGRIAALEAVRDLERARFVSLREMETTRKEKVARLQRDFKITLFQLEETLLRTQNEEMEFKKEVLVHDHALEKKDAEEQHERQLKELVFDAKNARTQLKARDQELQQATSARDAAQEEVSELRAEVARERTLVTATTSKLERARLQLDRAETDKEDIKRQLEEARGKHSELKRQLDDWDKLEKKGQAQFEQSRERCVELEVSVNAMEKRLAQKEQKLKEMEKEMTRTQKRAEILESAKDKAENEAQQREEEIQKLREKLDKLQARLMSRGKKDKEDQDEVNKQPLQQGEEAEEPLQPAKAAKKRQKPKQKPSPAADSDHEPSNPPPKEENKAKVAKRKGKAKQSPVEEEASQVGDPDSTPPVQHASEESKVRPKKGAKSKRKDTQAVDNDSQAGDALENGKHKEGVSSMQPTDNKVKQAKPRKVRPPTEPEAGDTGTHARVLKRKAEAESASTLQVRPESPADEAAEGSSQEPMKKKKRKINILGAGVSGPVWNNVELGDGNSMIPTVLSPLKETDIVPGRSQSYLSKATRR